MEINSLCDRIEIELEYEESSVSVELDVQGVDVELTEEQQTMFRGEKGEKGEDGKDGKDGTNIERTSELINDGDGESPFATEDYVEQNGGKIDKIQKNGTDLPINNKVVNITVPTQASDIGAQPIIDTSHKLSADLVDDTNTTNKFVTASDKETWNNKQDAIEDLSTIREGAEAGATAVQSSDLGALASKDTVDYATEVTNKPTIPTVNNGILTIQKNGTSIDTFSANQSSNKIINITVPTQASDISALASSTKYGASIALSINSTTFVITAQLKDQDGNNLGDAASLQVIGVQDVQLDNNSVVNNSTAHLFSEVSIGDDTPELEEKLWVDTDAEDLTLADFAGDSTHRTVTDAQISTWNGKLDTSKVKSTTSTTAGDVYDVTYINTMLGNIESLLSEV